MRTVPVRGVGPAPESLISELQHALGERLTLADVLAWARAQTPPLQVAEIVTQDEYTHDIVLPFRGRTFLAFDAT